MKIDLFDLLEGVFRGIVFFFYNLAETIYEMARHPYRGGLRLYCRHRDPQRRQMSSMTFIFLFYFAICSLFLLTTYRSDIRDEKLFRTVYGGEGFDSDILWAALAGSLAAFIILDAPLRLLLFYRLRGPRYRRALLVSCVQYSLFWPVAVFFAGAMLVAVLSGSGEAPLSSLIVGFGLMLIASVPAATLLAQGRRWTGRPAAVATPAGTDAGSAGSPTRSIHRPAAWRIAANALLVASLLLAASAAAGELSSKIRLEKIKAAAREQGARLIELGLTCRLRGGRPEVEVTVWNPSAAKIMLFPGSVEMESAQGGGKPYQLQAHPDHRALLSLDAGQIGSLVGRPPADVRTRTGSPCRLSGIQTIEAEDIRRHHSATAHLQSTWE